MYELIDAYQRVLRCKGKDSPLRFYHDYSKGRKRQPIIVEQASGKFISRVNAIKLLESLVIKTIMN